MLIRRFFQRIIDEKCEVQITLAKDIPRNHWPDLNELRFDEDKSINFKIEQLMVQKSQFNLEREKRTQEYNKHQRTKEFDFRISSYNKLREKFLADKEVEEYSKMVTNYTRLFRRGLISTASFLNFKREILNLAVQVHTLEDLSMKTAQTLRPSRIYLSMLGMV
ncbi:MAG TPA: hypothetical protein VKZ84_07420 [Bacteriovoracaceae bacterium]|nr:hypothetical protein [Bacteriovoracaceae bacterium]